MAEQTRAGAANLRRVARESSGRSMSAQPVTEDRPGTLLLYGSDAAPLGSQRALALRGRLEAPRDLGAQPVSRHDRVDHLLRSELVDVDVRLVLVAQLLDVGGPLGLGLLLDLVEVDRV